MGLVKVNQDPGFSCPLSTASAAFSRLVTDTPFLKFVLIKIKINRNNQIVNPAVNAFPKIAMIPQVFC
jgi:hypothetical protein